MAVAQQPPTVAAVAEAGFGDAFPRRLATLPDAP